MKKYCGDRTLIVFYGQWLQYSRYIYLHHSFVVVSALPGGSETIIFMKFMISNHFIMIPCLISFLISSWLFSNVSRVRASTRKLIMFAVVTDTFSFFLTLTLKQSISCSDV